MTTNQGNMKEQWKNNLQRKMSDYEEPAPEGLWTQLESFIDGQEPKPSLKKDNHKIIFWISSIGVAAAVLAFVLLTNKETVNIDLPNNQSAIIASNGDNHSASSQNEPLPYCSANNLQVVKASYLRSNSPSALTQNNVEASTYEKEGASTASVTSENSPLQPAETKKNTYKTTQDEKPTNKVAEYNNYSQNKYASINRISVNNGNSSHLSASLYTSNLPSSSNMKSGSAIPLVASSGGMDKGVLPPNNMNMLLAPSQKSEITTDTKHRLPIKVGMSVKYKFNDRWGIESGIAYSHLSSHISTGSDDYSQEIEQKLNFIGIPIKASFSIWKNDRFEIYTSAGGMVDKCIDGSSTIDNVLDGVVVSTENESTKVKQLQFSANATAGIQMNILPKLGIYVEPGINYYFDNNSPVETIYKDKPLNFNLQFGLRLSFK